jgi:hypothetical protein
MQAVEQDTSRFSTGNGSAPWTFFDPYMEHLRERLRYRLIDVFIRTDRSFASEYRSRGAGDFPAAPKSSKTVGEIPGNHALLVAAELRR